ncbi:sensor histidine kinase [Richelia sinica]|uniref:sensor histidine kinase n=1 Tax=Richelia sinica TaxID=1357545 RepID=UPI001FD3E7E2|nr:ATP-binding protein [Richelia sinica]
MNKLYGDLPLVECYPGQLNQVFMNLLANALDALVNRCAQADLTSTESETFQPQLTIETLMVDNQFVRVKITDNGMGMSPDIQAKIFNPFFTTKPIGQGTGLGLSISYKIVVDKHKGSIWCESEPGEGTSFYIQIPVQQVS